MGYGPGLGLTKRPGGLPPGKVPCQVSVGPWPRLPQEALAIQAIERPLAIVRGTPQQQAGIALGGLPAPLRILLAHLQDAPVPVDVARHHATGSVGGNPDRSPLQAELGPIGIHAGQDVEGARVQQEGHQLVAAMVGRQTVQQGQGCHGTGHLITLNVPVHPQGRLERSGPGSLVGHLCQHQGAALGRLPDGVETDKMWNRLGHLLHVGAEFGVTWIVARLERWDYGQGKLPFNPWGGSKTAAFLGGVSAVTSSQALFRLRRKPVDRPSLRESRS